MSWFSLGSAKPYIAETFAEAAIGGPAAAQEPPAERKAAKPKATKKRPAPVSVRFTAEERTQLEREAGNGSLSGHIRARLFEQTAKPKRTHKSPVKDRKTLAQLLSALGRSNLARDVEALEWAVKDGTVQLSPESERAFQQACHAVTAMRGDLLKALGLKP